jgi:hypothetical protein
MADVPLIVVGASLGGLSAMDAVLKELSPSCPAAIFDVLDASLQRSIRLLNERKKMCLDAADAARRSNHEQKARQWEKAAEEAAARFERVEQLLEAYWTRPELAGVSASGDATAKHK